MPIAQPDIRSIRFGWSSTQQPRRAVRTTSRGTDAIAHHREFGNLSELSRANKGNYYKSNPVRVQSDIVMYRSKRVALPFARTASHDRSRWSERRSGSDPAPIRLPPIRLRSRELKSRIQLRGTQHPDVNGKQVLASQLLALPLRSTSLYVELVTLSTVAILAQGTISG